jgi:L-cysteate sulfo-lyase
MQLARFARARFCHLPTPLESLPRLSAHLGGPAILVKRDDATGLAFGGNKTRKLEFVLGEALAAGADTVITTGSVQSNHCRQTAAAAARLGLGCHLVLQREVARDDARYERTGNALLDRLAGAELHPVGRDADRDATMAALAEELRAAGLRPAVIPVGASTPVGAHGYVVAGLEILAQAEALGRPLDAIVHASGSGGTQAGLLVAMAGVHGGVPVLGISDGEPRAALEAVVGDLAERTAALLGVPNAAMAGLADRVEVLDEYFGDAYGQPTAGMVEAIRLCARLEGLFLDPVYSGKAMAGLIDQIRQGRWSRSQTVVFVHTGGTPALFAYVDALTSA